LRFTGKLPQGFVLSKPITQDNYKEEDIEALEKQGRLIITRKRDGWKLFAATDKAGKVRLYTDGMNEVDERLDHIKEEVAAMGWPPCSLLVGEVLFDRDDNDDLGGVQSVMGASTEKALAFQKANGKLRYMLFGILFFEGKRCEGLYSEYLDMMGRKGRYVFAVEDLSYGSRCTFEQAKALVRERGWEGLVLYDEEFVPEIRLDGKSPKRTKGCWKWKPIIEDDFIVREKIMRPDGKLLKELVLLQIDPSTGSEFYCGKLGTFSNAMRAELTAARLPLVVQAEFEARYPKTGKIRNARFVRIRADKKAQDCRAPKSYPEA
jgi:ATP-dependent DNA ligase